MGVNGQDCPNWRQRPLIEEALDKLLKMAVFQRYYYHVNIHTGGCYDWNND